MADRDEEILKEFKEILGVGNINRYEAKNAEHENQVRFDVSGVVDILNCVIPFFEKFGREKTYKQTQYKKWKKELFEDYEIEGIRDPDFKDED